MWVTGNAVQIISMALPQRALRIDEGMKLLVWLGDKCGGNNYKI
jgi:hypothetical protein